MNRKIYGPITLWVPLLAGALLACSSPEAEDAVGETKHGLFSTPWGQANVAYREYQGQALIGGDMLLPLPQGAAWTQKSALRPAGFARRAGATSWPQGVVPFAVDLPLLGTDPRIVDAIAEWESKTRIQFVPWTVEPEYVVFQRPPDKPNGLPDLVCNSGLGRWPETATVINLGDTCNTPNAVHEIGHAMGLWHEHQRPDRDLYIQVDLTMLHPDELDKADQFDKIGDVGTFYRTGRSVGPYDIDSVMHYDSTAFSISQSDYTILGLDPLTGLFDVVIPPDTGDLTPTDVLAAHKANGLEDNLDVNGDGYSDLVVGVPGETVNGAAGAGAIQVIFGSAAGIGTTDTFIHRDLAWVTGTPDAADRLGEALAFGDFNSDGFTDIAAGAPGVDALGVVDSGAVQIFYGGPLGPTWDDVLLYPQPATIGDQFGHALAAGDFNGDGFEDLAIGIPFKDAKGIVDQGNINVVYGGPSGLSSTGSQIWSQNSGSIWDSGEANDWFGFALAAGDFNRDGFAELAIGIPNEDYNGKTDMGAVAVLLGSIDGLTDDGNQFWHGDDIGVDGFFGEAGDLFGYALTTGNFNGLGWDGLAIGLPLRDVGGHADAGAVVVLYGDPAQPKGLWNDELLPQVFAQGTAPCTNQDGNCQVAYGNAEASDVFGRALASGDFDGDGSDDLAIGVPYEGVSGKANAGAVNILYGSLLFGLSGNSDPLKAFHQNAGIQDSAQANDHFGFRLRVGDFNGDTLADLAIAVPDEDLGAAANCGAVHVLFGVADPITNTYGLTANGNQFLHQDAALIPDSNENGDAFGLGL